MHKLALLVVLLIGLIFVQPTTAQDTGTARIQFANLVVSSTVLTITTMDDEPLVDVGAYGSISDWVDVPAPAEGFEYALEVGSTSWVGSNSSSEPLFVVGHEYLVLALGDEEEWCTEIIDLTTAFGTAEATTGQGRLLLVHYTATVPSARYTLEGESGALNLFLLTKASSFSPDATKVGVAQAPGDYTVSIADSDEPNATLIAPVALTLADNQTTILAVFESSLGPIHGYLLSTSGVTILDQ